MNLARMIHRGERNAVNSPDTRVAISEYFVPIRNHSRCGTNAPHQKLFGYDFDFNTIRRFPVPDGTILNPRSCTDRSPTTLHTTPGCSVKM
jgi:hypothetical protein